MDVSLLIRQRLRKMGLEQKDLAVAAEVTESYISQLLARKKMPPAPGRTDIYEKIGELLQLPSAKLTELANLQRAAGLRKKVAESTRPLFRECRDLVLRKCNPENRSEIEQIFSKDPFGELERLVTQTLLDVTQGVVKTGLEDPAWQQRIAPLRERSYNQARVALLEFLDTDVFSITVENCVGFLDPILDRWQMNLKDFSIEVELSREFSSAGKKRFTFSEQTAVAPVALEPGLVAFLRDVTMSKDVTEEEIEFLKALTLRGRRPTALFYYRELQNLRDPLHFTDGVTITARS